MSANVRTAAYNLKGGVPWWIGGSEDHGQATALEAMADAKTMIVASGLDYEVNKRPMYVYLNDADEAAGKLTEVPGRFGIVRSDDNTLVADNTRVFSDVAVGEIYVPIQNKEIFECCDIIAQASPLAKPYETAGGLNDGKTVWMLMRVGEDLQVADDSIRNYLLATTAHDGSSALRFKIVKTRVVCNNTLDFALSETTNEFSIRHSTNYREKLAAAREVLLQIPKATAAFEDFAQSMLAKKIDKNTYNKLSEILFPFPEDGTDRQLENVNKKRTLLAKAIIMDDIEHIRFTGWGALNAVADMEQHLVPLGGKSDEQKLARIFERSFEGGELVRKAQQFLVEA